MMAPQATHPVMRRVRRIHMLGIGGSGMAGIAPTGVMLINLARPDQGAEGLAFEGTRRHVVTNFACRPELLGAAGGDT